MNQLSLLFFIYFLIFKTNKNYNIYDKINVMKESYLYKKFKENKIQCQTCSHFCLIKEGERGKCGVRENRQGKLYALNYEKIIATHIDPIEKKPLFHFLPQSSSYSIATVGCNLACLFCQNWDISQDPKPKNPILGEKITPQQIVNETLKSKCQSIAYTYTEPTIFLELALDTMKIAKKKGLRNIWVSNGFMSPQTLELVTPYLDAINVDLKSFSEKFYKEICNGRLRPVLENLKEIYKKKIHLEITTLIIPGFNDSEKELYQIAQFIKKELGAEIPWHISRFFPAYKMNNVPPTPAEKIHQAYRIGKKAGLLYVYAGNIPGNNINGLKTESTYCPECKKLIIERFGFAIETNNLTKDGECKFCKTNLNIKVN